MGARIRSGRELSRPPVPCSPSSLADAKFVALVLSNPVNGAVLSLDFEQELDVVACELELFDETFSTQDLMPNECGSDSGDQGRGDGADGCDEGGLNLRSVNQQAHGSLISRFLRRSARTRLAASSGEIPSR